MKSLVCMAIISFYAGSITCAQANKKFGPPGGAQVEAEKKSAEEKAADALLALAMTSEVNKIAKPSFRILNPVPEFRYQGVGRCLEIGRTCLCGHCI